MKLKKALTLTSAAILSVVLITGCGKNVKSGNSEDAANAIAAAQASMKKASSLKWIWRDTGKNLKKAQAAQKKGDNSAAVKFANKAKAQAELAIQQYHYEKTINRSVKSKKRRKTRRKRRTRTKKS